jgi:hypothetical protein
MREQLPTTLRINMTMRALDSVNNLRLSMVQTCSSAPEFTPKLIDSIFDIHDNASLDLYAVFPPEVEFLPTENLRLGMQEAV